MSLKQLKKFKQEQKSSTNQPDLKKDADVKRSDNLSSKPVVAVIDQEIQPQPIEQAKEDNHIPSNEQPERTVSSSEKIRQISSQLNGLMSQTHEFLNGETELNNDTSQSELEKRNIELAALLDKRSQLIEQLTNQNNDLKRQNTKLQQQLQHDQDDIEQRHLKEQGSLKEQLQVHIQTIGILVAEKTELQSSLSQTQQIAKQKAAEIDEFQGRLKGARQRIVDLEREYNNTATSNQQLEKNTKELSKEVDRLKMDFYKNSKQLDEYQQQNSELSEKLNTKIGECNRLQEDLDEAKNNLSMAQLRVQQLSSSDDVGNHQLLEELNEGKIRLEKSNSQLKESLHAIGQERDSLADQYQKITQQLNSRIESLSEQATRLGEDKASVANENLKLNSRILELEEKCKINSSRVIDDSAIGELQTTIDELRRHKSEMEEQQEKQIADNSQLSDIIEDMEVRIHQLQNELRSAQLEQVDKKSLLEEIQSDKVAASRALLQNRELKNQLEELQNGFIIISNDKLDVLEKCESERSISRELGERLVQQEDEINQLRNEISSRDRQLDLSKKSSTELTKQMYQQQQLVDRVRHYEAQGQLSELLQTELDQAKDRVNSLMAQNQELRTLLAQQAQQLLQSKDNTSDRQDSSKTDDMIASLSASVHQLEMERDQLLRQLGEQQGQRETFRAQLKEMKENQLNHGGENGETVPTEEYDNVKQVLHQLESRFTKTMKEIAELSDQKQQLEHLVTQLQGETDTIGEYIALYQVQRGLMKQRALEKDEYIAQLARDREDMKTKLTELQLLVTQLLYERSHTDSLKPPGKVVSTPGSAATMTALNGVAALPDWPDLVDDLDDASSRPGSDAFVDVKLTPKKQNDATAKKIINLISEIGLSSLIEKPVLDNFHPCPLCSGKLMTV